ncbi:hypothetical protein A3A50_02415 [Candidatus Woesebacteria bacterium RIFCSPLOWO2_01_FULL_38_20]|nr:MAG: hypothetical protein A3A50_02415 [Candidatus Woesebacteria bacterium RIFCSPLOWO2_01_FULL_38_20]
MNFLILLGCLLILCFNGMIILYSISKTKNKLLLLGGGMILGPSGLLLILGVLSYFLKGYFAIQAIFLGYFLACFVIYKHALGGRFSLLNHFKKKDILFPGLPILIFGFSIFLFGSNYEIGGDVDLWFPIATSFARGNYPVLLPWQPNFLTIYHTGTFLVEGALYSISSMNILAVHTFFTSFLVSAIFIFVTGIAREKTKSIISFFPALSGLILFSGPILLMSGFKNFFSGIFKEFVIYPQIGDLKGASGGGPLSVLDLLMKSYYTFALAIFLVFIYFLCLYSWKSIRVKYLILALLTGLIASADESFFIIAVILMGSSLFFIFWKITIRKFITVTFMICIVLGLILILVQNSLRDSFLTVHTGIPRFKLIIPGVRSGNIYDSYENIYRYTSTKFVEFENLDYLKNKLKSGDPVYSDFKNTKWYLPGIYIVIFVALVISFLIKSKLSFVLSLISIFSSGLSVVIVNSFAEFHSLRFLDQAYHLLGFAMGFLVLDLFLFLKRKKVLTILFTLLFLYIFAPQTINSGVYLLQQDFFSRHMNNFKLQRSSYDITLSQISKILTYNQRIIFVDKYPQFSNSSDLTAQAYLNYGLFTTISPPSTKVLNPEGGGEWYDAVLSLSPSSIKKLGVDYVFVTNSGLDRLLLERRKQLEDRSLFNQVYLDKEGRLYKIFPKFKNLPENNVTLEQISNLIPNGKIIYIDAFKPNEIRKALTLSLAARTKLIGPEHHIAGGDFFMYIEAILPFYRVCLPSECLKRINNSTIDYAILKSGINPNQILSGNFTKLIEAPQVVLWKLD